MNRDVSSFSLSFFMHALTLGIFFYVFPALDLQPKPVLIDFSIIPQGTVSERVLAAPEQKKEEKQIPDLQVPPKPRELAKPKPIERVVPRKKPKAVLAPKVLARPVEKILPPKQKLPVQAEPQLEPTDIVSPVPAGDASPEKQLLPTTKAVAVKNDGQKAATGIKTSKAMEQHYVKAHFVYIKKIIEKNINYPPMARRMGWQGKVLVSFIVCSDGRIEDLEVVESSGYVQLDKNALETVRQVQPFPRPPIRVKLVLPVNYRLG